jgi:peptide/nickel transport system permease protein
MTNSQEPNQTTLDGGTMVVRSDSERPWIIGISRALWNKPLGFWSFFVLVIISVFAIGANWLAPYGIDDSTGLYTASPGFGHLFGTDHLGRDVLSRTIFAGQVSLRVGFMAVALGTIVGAVAGLVSGYFGGYVDQIIQRIVDVMMSIPTILLALTVIASLGADALNVTLAIGTALAPRTARVARGSALSVKELDYITAAHALGSTPVRVMFRHVLPNAAAPLIVIASVQLGTAIITEASLSYLGLGVPLNVPTWGNMLSGAGLTYMTKAPWMAIFPGLALTTTVLALNLFGDALRDILDPKLRGSK